MQFKDHRQKYHVWQPKLNVGKKEKVSYNNIAQATLYLFKYYKLLYIIMRKIECNWLSYNSNRCMWE